MSEREGERAGRGKTNNSNSFLKVGEEKEEVKALHSMIVYCITLLGCVTGPTSIVVVVAVVVVVSASVKLEEKVRRKSKTKR